jgi:hypothetical protein
MFKDRRRGMTACPACWAMGTKEVNKKENNILYWAD